MRRVLPDLFRERLRHCLALETHRWQQRIGYAAFDDEAFAERELLCTILHDEHMATGLQVSVTAAATVAEPHSGELDYNGPELAHSAELDYQGADDLPELLPREAAQAPAPRGFARPGDLSAGGGVV